MDFRKLLQIHHQVGRHVCAGIDLTPDSIKPGMGLSRDWDGVITMARDIVDATLPYVAAYKPNFAFYESGGYEGIDALEEIISYIRSQDPEKINILDGKRGDIGKSNHGTRGLLELLQVHAVTVNPFLGEEALEPLLNSEVATFTLCHTSNKGSGEFQERLVNIRDDEAGRLEGKGNFVFTLNDQNSQGPRKIGPCIFMAEQHHLIAVRVSEVWRSKQPRGLVVGATYPDQLKDLRAIAGDETPFLIPGVGAQGGDLEAAVKGAKGAGNGRFLINVSSAITGASEGSDFAAAAGNAARAFHEAIGAALKS